MTEADEISDRFLKSWENLAVHIDSGWVTRRGDAVAMVTGIQVPFLNGVWLGNLGPDARTVRGLLDDVERYGFPYCIQFRPHDSRAGEEIAAERGMSLAEEMPLMVLHLNSWESGAWRRPELQIRRLGADETAIHAKTAASGFDVPEETFLQLIPSGFLGAGGVRCYVGAVGGEVVTTSLGVDIEDSVGIFNVATVPGHRGRGYGAAITAAAANDGFAGGARRAWLQSSPEGYRVYDRMGFETLEQWQCWVSPPAT